MSAFRATNCSTSGWLLPSSLLSNQTKHHSHHGRYSSSLVFLNTFLTFWCWSDTANLCLRFELHLKDIFRTSYTEIAQNNNLTAGLRLTTRQLDWLPFKNQTRWGRLEKACRAFVCLFVYIPVVGGLAEIRYDRLEIRVFSLLTFQFAEQRLAMMHQTVFQQFSVHLSTRARLHHLTADVSAREREG